MTTSNANAAILSLIRDLNPQQAGEALFNTASHVEADALIGRITSNEAIHDALGEAWRQLRSTEIDLTQKCRSVQRNADEIMERLQSHQHATGLGSAAADVDRLVAVREQNVAWLRSMLYLAEHYAEAKRPCGHPFEDATLVVSQCPTCGEES